MTDVAWSSYHELYHMDDENLQTFLNFESESGLGVRYLICKPNLGIDLEDVGFQLHTCEQYYHMWCVCIYLKHPLNYILISKFHPL